MDHSTPRPQSREALITAVVSEVLRLLGDAAPSPRIRELRAQARFYEQAIRHWTTVPPSKVQLDAMLDLVTELRTKAVSTGRGARA